MKKSPKTPKAIYATLGQQLIDGLQDLKKQLDSGKPIKAYQYRNGKRVQVLLKKGSGKC